ncbi:MAG: 4Fe-4S ferredoxin [Bacteroidetes bacterium]|nr:4Fe-4S ferredoxin [Bacteroidota bacterium]
MTRDIIEINEELCDGCGDCVIGCAEGAIRIVNGKAKLVREDFCDGFGDCVAVCHSGALKVIRRPAVAFDDAATREHLLRTEGPEAVQRYIEAQHRHEAEEPRGAASDGPHISGGCPGSMQRELRHGVDIPILQHSAVTASADATAVRARDTMLQDHREASSPQQDPAEGNASPWSEGQQVLLPSELGQWPVQLHLVQPGAPFFRDREMVIMSTCGPIASAEVHQRYLRNRSVVVACPKLDNTAPYAEKLGAILRDASIPKAIVVIMEVPCCQGLSMITVQALALSGREDLVVEEHVLTLQGDLKSIRRIG